MIYWLNRKSERNRQTIFSLDFTLAGLSSEGFLAGGSHRRRGSTFVR